MRGLSGIGEGIVRWQFRQNVRGHDPPVFAVALDSPDSHFLDAREGGLAFRRMRQRPNTQVANLEPSGPLPPCHPRHPISVDTGLRASCNRRPAPWRAPRGLGGPSRDIHWILLSLGASPSNRKSLASLAGRLVRLYTLRPNLPSFPQRTEGCLTAGPKFTWLAYALPLGPSRTIS